MGSAPAGKLSHCSTWRYAQRSATLAFASPAILLLCEGGRRARCPWGCPQHPRGTLPPSPRTLCQDVKPVEPQHLTYSGTAPKSGTARASAAKILQYSRLEFWILHSWRFKQKSQRSALSRTNASLGPPAWPGIPWDTARCFLLLAVKGQVMGKLRAAPCCSERRAEAKNNKDIASPLEHGSTTSEHSKSGRK